MIKRITLILGILFYFISVAFIFLSIYVEQFDSKRSLHIEGMIIISGIIICSLLIASLFVCISNNNPKIRKLVIRSSVFIMFGYYVFTVINLLFFDTNFGRQYGFSDYMDFKMFFENSTNFMPLTTLTQYMESYKTHSMSLRIIVVNLFGNLVAFVPIGLFLPCLFKSMKKAGLFLITAAVCISLVEVIQLLTRTGICDIDDLILNLLGAIIGYIFIKNKFIQKNLNKIYL